MRNIVYFTYMRINNKRINKEQQNKEQQNNINYRQVFCKMLKFYFEHMLSTYLLDYCLVNVKYDDKLLTRCKDVIKEK